MAGLYYIALQWVKYSKDGKVPACNAGDPGRPQVGKIPWEETATSGLAWKIPVGEEPGGLQSAG